MKKSNYSSIESIISTAKKGGMFILVDDEKRENEGDLVISTTDTNAKNINFMAKYGRGLICLALDSLQAKRLNLSLMSPVNQSRNKTAFTISIEARKGITTGISAKDRARTIKIASKKNVNKKDIVSPGHVFPIIAKDGGVLVRAGHTEASVDISKLARKNNSAVICEIMNEDGTMAKGQELFDFAYKHQLKIGKIEDLIAYRLKKEKLIRLKKQGFIDVKNQKYKIRIYENLLDGSEHFALIKGTIKKGITPRVRVISSNVVKNYLINQKLPNSFNKTLNYFKKFNNCVLVFIKDSNLKSVTQTLKDYKDKDLYKKSKEKSLKNYGIGAQIIKDLKIKNFEPSIVLIPFPDRHQDHKAVFDLSMTATRPKGVGKQISLVACYEVPSSTYFSAPKIEPNFYPNWNVDISSTIKKKINALKQYKSTLSKNEFARSTKAINSLASFRGSQVGFDYAECFYIIRMQSKNTLF